MFELVEVFGGELGVDLEVGELFLDPAEGLEVVGDVVLEVEVGLGELVDAVDGVGVVVGFGFGEARVGAGLAGRRVLGEVAHCAAEVEVGDEVVVVAGVGPADGALFAVDPDGRVAADEEEGWLVVGVVGAGDGGADDARGLAALLWGLVGEPVADVLGVHVGSVYGRVFWCVCWGLRFGGLG